LHTENVKYSNFSRFRQKYSNSGGSGVVVVPKKWMAVQKASGWQRYKKHKFTYIHHETIGGNKAVEQDVEQDVKQGVEIVCNVQRAKSLKKINRLGSSVWDLFERTTDEKTAKLVFNQRNVI